MASEFLDNKTWRYFWHPVCTLKELADADEGRGPLLKLMLLGQELVVAQTASGVVAFDNRCPHRSAKLSLGWVEGDSIRCPYHGWRYRMNDGKCVEIPAAPDGPIPPNAQAIKFNCKVAYDLVWVCLDSSANTTIPEHLVFDDPEFKCVQGPSYVWKTHSVRRVENYVDLAHFPFVHPETLGSSDHNTFIAPNIDFQKEGTLRFRYLPTAGSRSGVDSQGKFSPLKFSDYRIRVPFGVTVDLTLENDTRTVLWVWATPIDDTHCRTFWFACRNTDHDGPDQPHIDVQARILEEDIDIVESQDPEQIPHPRDEIAIGPDKVSLTYRKVLYDMCRAKGKGPDVLQRFLTTERENI